MVLAIDDRVDHHVPIIERRNEDAVLRGGAGEVTTGDEEGGAEDLGEAGGLVLEPIAGRDLPARCQLGGWGLLWV